MPSAQDAARCVFCRKRPVEPAWRPFCSERCKTRDLANWADQSYRVAAEPLGEAGETPDSPEPSSF